jgi:hypothetical protein
MTILICRGKLFAMAKCRNAKAKHTLPWQMQTFNAFLQRKVLKIEKQNILTFKTFSLFCQFKIVFIFLKREK